MQTKKLLFYILIPLAGVILLFGFYKINRLDNQLEHLTGKQNQLLDSVRMYEQLHAADSLLLTGAYGEAIEAYEAQWNDSTTAGFVSISDHLQIARLLLQVSSVQVDSGSVDTVTLVVDNKATPEEVRQFDSLTFALTKASWQIENLQEKLTRATTQGQYITFTSSKGTTVHYVGEVRNNKAHGKGVALLSSGSRYEGEWKNNQRDGYGTFYWADGEYYQGNYKEDKRHGKGTYYWTNGEKFNGQWEDDQRNGKGIFYGEDGEIMAQGIWKNDELVEVEK